MTRVGWLLCLAGAGCALDAGAPLATLADGTLTARLVLPSARDLGEDTLLGAGGERVRITALVLTVGEVVLSSGSAGGGAFDPASPPPGFSTCHSGHCHSADGRLVPYAEVQLEAASGGSGLAVALAMPVGTSLDLLRDAPLALARFEPSRDLSRVTVVRGEVVVERLAMTARIEGARNLDVRVDLELDQRWASELDLEVAGGPPVVSPRVELTLDGLFLDGLDTLTTTTTTLVLDRPDAPGADALIRALSATRPTISLAEVTSEE